MPLLQNHLNCINGTNKLEILIAEDDKDTACAFRMALVDRGHDVLIADNGERCLEVYNDKLQNIRYSIHSTASIQPFE